MGIVKQSSLFFIAKLCILGVLLGGTSTTCRAQDPVILPDSCFKSVIYHLQEQHSILKQNKIGYDSIIPIKSKKTVRIYANKYLESIPFREEVVKSIKDSLKKYLTSNYSNYKVEMYINKYEISDLVPNIYRENYKIDKERLEKHRSDGTAFVTNLSNWSQPTLGLLNNNLAVWPSHGWYYERKENEWVWQRPHLFSVTEDTYTLGYVLPYLVPMLENAGAYVMLPRERDTQLNEVIVDNDDHETFFYEECHDKVNKWRRGDTTGFANPRELYREGENPFCYGTYRKIKTSKEGMGYANWTPEIPESGDYAVYISYHSYENSATDAHYTVYHTGGATEFLVNQKMGGSTWIYLGTFNFKKGTNPSIGRVELSNKSKSNNDIITADAVRFGGGYGNIGRLNQQDSVIYSNKPRYLEGARYWLQWAGYSDSIYNRNDYKDDYKDDYMCRGHWVNDLIGGSSKSPNTTGKNIPIQLSMGFHTDAGQVFNDSIIGTMSIYMSESNGSRNYANGQRRIVSRDLADIIQTQIVNDIRNTYRPDWTRRKLTDASYYEARVPEVPTFLLELLSHQNFTDMRYGLDPHFRFTVSRSIYKGILKFLAYQQEREYVIQPLPVNTFGAEFVNEENNVIRLSWAAQQDSLEPTATPDYYILYTANDEGGWNNGEIIRSTFTHVTLEPKKIYRFKVTAVNKGGESFPSEELAVGYVPNTPKTALIINGFHRVSAPEWFDTPDYSGFLDNLDQGVPDKYDLSYTGSQYAFNKRSKYRNNANPGHGACYALFENEKIAGNTFNFTYIHGKAIMAAGYSFVSCSDEVVKAGLIRLKNYRFLDLILGEEKSTLVGQETRYQLFPSSLRQPIRQYLMRQQGNIYVNGAYVASDLYERDSCDTEAIQFAERVLKYKLGESKLKTKGLLSNYFSPWKIFKQKYYHYCNIPNSKQYAVEVPDALDISNGSKVIHSFEGSNLPATVGYNGRYKTIISSVPFESIESEKERLKLMKEIIQFFEKK